jgi:hypothetical protein
MPPAGESGRICATNAVAALAATHPTVAAQVTDALITSLRASSGDDYLMISRVAVSSMPCPPCWLSGDSYLGPVVWP